MCPSACPPGHSEVHRALAVSLLIELLNLLLEVPQFALQVVAASLLVQEAAVLGKSSKTQESPWGTLSLSG